MIKKSGLAGLTLVELLCVLVIVATLAGLMVPVLTQAKLAARKSSSLERMRQLYVGLSLYRENYEKVSFGNASAMGLPTIEQLIVTRGGTTGGFVAPELWQSPCGVHPQGPHGFWTYSYHADDDGQFSAIASKYEGRTPLISDLPCSDFKGFDDSRMLVKSVPYINVEGTARVHRGRGLPFDLRFFIN